MIYFYFYALLPQLKRMYFRARETVQQKRCLPYTQPTWVWSLALSSLARSDPLNAECGVRISTGQCWACPPMPPTQTEVLTVLSLGFYILRFTRALKVGLTESSVRAEPELQGPHISFQKAHPGSSDSLIHCLTKQLHKIISSKQRMGLFCLCPFFH